jgi:hypothetical protein
MATKGRARAPELCAACRGPPACDEKRPPAAGLRAITSEPTTAYRVWGRVVEASVRLWRSGHERRLRRVDWQAWLCFVRVFVGTSGTTIRVWTFYPKFSTDKCWPTTRAFSDRRNQLHLLPLPRTPLRLSRRHPRFHVTLSRGSRTQSSSAADLTQTFCRTRRRSVRSSRCCCSSCRRT